MPEASKRGRQSSSSDDSPAAKKTAPSSTSSEPERTVQPPVIPAKVFRLKHVFEEISTLRDDEDYDSHDWEDYFGLDWRIVVTITDDNLSAYVEEKSEEMCIEGVLKFDLIGRNADSTEKKLSDKIINEITTLDEYKEVIGGDIDSFDHELAKKLLKKGAEILLV
ncbi:hypothetical protein CAEBREN_17204 [Caenorhabditis brenneri]|uniref:MATH domain-containing protein n=1 Tax=Caenorhabditis brenneri TaxID=135651 RepID=G0MCS2_CAEBE|nr:hypothetical protein CAEBREN_17204 [Caenorhabditis brenneri]